MQERRKSNLNEELIKVNLEYISKEISDVKKSVQDVNAKLDSHYVTKDELEIFRANFQPVKVIVYTIVSTAGVGAIVALLTTILK